MDAIILHVNRFDFRGDGGRGDQIKGCKLQVLQDGEAENTKDRQGIPPVELAADFGVVDMFKGVGVYGISYKLVMKGKNTVPHVTSINLLRPVDLLGAFKQK